MVNEKNMLDVFKSILQEGMEIDKVKEYNSKYKFVMTYNGMTANCELVKTCALGHEKRNCMAVINNAMSTMYINAGNLKEAKAWLDGERWNNEPANDASETTNLEGFIKSKCYEVLNQKEIYNNLLKSVQESADKLDTDPHFYVGYIDTKTSEMNMEFKNYMTMKHDLSQFAHILGDRYVEIMDSILTSE